MDYEDITEGINEGMRMFRLLAGEQDAEVETAARGAITLAIGYGMGLADRDRLRAMLLQNAEKPPR